MSGVSLRSEPGVIVLRSLSPATAAALRTQARAMFTAGTGAPISLNDR
jgi:hypothetical protein